MREPGAQLHADAASAGERTWLARVLAGCAAALFRLATHHSAGAAMKMVINDTMLPSVRSQVLPNSISTWLEPAGTFTSICPVVASCCNSTPVPFTVACHAG